MNNCDDFEISGETMTANELAMARKARHDPNFIPQGQVNPLHEGWNDDEVVTLNPFFQLQQPPTLEQMDQLLSEHAVLEARPGRPYHRETMFSLARYALRRNTPEWTIFAGQLAEREKFDLVLQKIAQSNEGKRAA